MFLKNYETHSIIPEDNIMIYAKIQVMWWYELNIKTNTFKITLIKISVDDVRKYCVHIFMFAYNRLHIESLLFISHII